MFELSDEHQARELLNVIMLLERCLALPAAAPDEQAEWRRELASARQHLDELISPGRSTSLLTRQLASNGAAPPVK